jgi:anti-sigma factor ChrR (cupin superfamily)
MLVNADFSRRITITPDQYQWVASPQSGVERVMLDRVGAENARATSIVRYAPHSYFPPHAHPGGEEILVLSGTFSDESADFPEGWYLRNPPEWTHQPFSREGAVIFVKLRQMTPGDDRCVRVNTRDPSSWERHGDRAVCPLFCCSGEQVSLHRLDPGVAILDTVVAGAEMLVLAGELAAQGKSFASGAWIRLPAGDFSEFSAGPEGATVYLKTGHLSAAMLEATP